MGYVQSLKWHGKIKISNEVGKNQIKTFQISTAYNPVLDRSECLALKNFKAGEQLFIFYGARSNADLFVHNG